eukprot:CAMPEP_0197432380 /NCGR_PEP_ID=MMETSP1175-20131217/443_1 /TAXON_ID=1003142 /ORGANISM="Triceratium dubium, Strain CCMP147" /LENGTH=160 /DNA_ID=CAMNT_0042960419 /DNA_START=48 /DNA_END=528 /DNA_ORIENTATION=+
MTQPLQVDEFLFCHQRIRDRGPMTFREFLRCSPLKTFSIRGMLRDFLRTRWMVVDGSSGASCTPPDSSGPNKMMQLRENVQLYVGGDVIKEKAIRAAMDDRETLVVGSVQAAAAPSPQYEENASAAATGARDRRTNFFSADSLSSSWANDSSKVSSMQPA